MTQRFYFHDAATSVAGTLPGATALGNSGSVTGGTATGASTNRSMNGTPGAGQTSAALTTAATVNVQKGWFRRFISPELAAQTIPTGTAFALSIGASESNANSDMFEAGSLHAEIWTPSAGTGVAMNIIGSVNSPNVNTTLNEPGTTQTVCAATFTTTNATITIAAGDVIVVEVWSAQSQAMGTAYTNTIFYDGTTEGSITNIASYIDFGVDLTLYTPSAEQVPFVNVMKQLIAQ